MQWLVSAKFLQGGSLPPDEFFSRIKARWIWLEPAENIEPHHSGFEGATYIQPAPRSGICITDYESMEQLAADLAIMPGAGIYDIEVVQVSGEIKPGSLTKDKTAPLSRVACG